MNANYELDFARFEFKMSFRGLHYIATVPWIRNLWNPRRTVYTTSYTSVGNQLLPLQLKHIYLPYIQTTDEIVWQLANICIFQWLKAVNKYVWYYILSWCWWNFLTSANQIAQIGSCDRSGMHVPDLGGTGVWPGKNGFHKKCKNLDNIAVYLTAHLE